MNAKNKQQYVYISLLYVPSSVGKIVRSVARQRFSHATFSFDKDMNTCYAFSRIKENTPGMGGFTVENKSYYTSGKNVSIDQKIFEIPVSEEEIRQIRTFIRDVSKDKEYIYNTFSMCTLLVFHGIMIYKSFQCTDFIAKILTMISAVKLSRKWYSYLPSELEEDLNSFCIYDGMMDTKGIVRDEKDYFFVPVGCFTYFGHLLYSNMELLYRWIKKKSSASYNWQKVRFKE